MLWENLREEEFENAIEKAKGVCIVPVGCLEKHGQHLPVGTDEIHITEIARIARAMVEFSTDKLCEVIRFLKNEIISDTYKKEWLAKQR